MAIINKQDTNGTKATLAKGELGYDDYGAGGDAGRVYVGDGSINIALAKKSETDALTTSLNDHVGSGGTSHANATQAVAGFMSATDKVILDGMDPIQTINTSTKYVDSVTSTEYKLYVKNGQVVLEEL